MAPRENVIILPARLPKRPELYTRMRIGERMVV
jgi:hypothetical protein